MFSVKKLVVVVFVVLCFLRCFEFARIPRDDSAKESEDPTSPLAVGLQHFFDDLTKFKKAVVDDSLKNFFFDFRQSLEESEKSAPNAKS